MVIVNIVTPLSCFKSNEQARRENVMIRHFEDQLNIAIAQNNVAGGGAAEIDPSSKTEVSLPKQAAQLLVPALLDLIY